MTDQLSDQALQALIEDTSEAARLHDALLRRLLRQLATRYGAEGIVETRCDLIIDTIFAGSRREALAAFDIAMSNLGYPPRTGAPAPGAAANH